MKAVIYQLVIRYFGNTTRVNQTNGDITTNGCGKFADVNDDALASLKTLGVTHLWLAGCLRQATMTDYSAIGLPADKPDIVKGIAGSPYAVRDYYDVCPDYAVEPANRMREFEDLISRVHAAGLQALIDLVPNHVSRAYGTQAIGAKDALEARRQGGPGTATLGANDDTTRFFASENNFYHLPAGQRLHLSKPDSWNPDRVVFDGVFPPEDGSPGHPVKVTGDNYQGVSPSANGWYDTIKLNYGVDIRTGRKTFDPQPRTWADMDNIISHWQSKGVDGFRCDFAHWIPAEAWEFLIGRARARRRGFFFAEAYPGTTEADIITTQPGMIAAGFDAIYHYQSYNSLKQVYAGGSLDAYDREMAAQPVDMRAHLVNYLENHDECRIAAPVNFTSPANGGFGSSEAGYQLAPLQFLYSKCAALMLNGQEVGEPGAGIPGFPTGAGRTPICDYWCMTEFVKWVNDHRYDGGGLSHPQHALRNFYGALLKLCQHPSAVADGYWGLRYYNRPERFGDCPADLYTFARFQPGAGEALLVAANFRPGTAIAGQVRLPKELCQIINFADRVFIQLVLNRQGLVNQPLAAISAGDLALDGFAISIPNQTCHVYRIGS